MPGGIENADYETMIDCLRWAIDEGYLPSWMPATGPGRRMVGQELLRFIEGDPKDDLEARGFAEIYDLWEDPKR